MVSFKEASCPLGLFCNSKLNKKILDKTGKALLNYKEKHYSKAEKVFDELAISFSDSNTKYRKINYLILKSNSLKMLALRIYQKYGLTDELENILQEALELIEEALEFEPYWAEYRIYKDKLKKYIHDSFGCILQKEGNIWKPHCYKIARQSKLPGMSIGGVVDLKCSICGKDPIDCEHVAGEIYDGRMALHVVKDLKLDHVALVDIPQQKVTYVMPGPLTEEDIRRLFSQKEANLIISGNKQLRCKDLLKILITKNIRLSPVLNDDKRLIDGTVLQVD